MAGTLIVEPDPRGHRLQSVAHVSEVAARAGRVVLLTSTAALEDPAYEVYLGGAAALGVEAPFAEIQPPTRVMVEAIAERCRRSDIGTVVVMDADQSLKQWWLRAPRAFRGLPRKPRVVFMLTRYPAKLRLTDRVGWKLRLAKSGLALVAMATGSLHRVSGYAGRDDVSRGWIVKRTRDFHECTAHSRDRATLRDQLGLPPDRRIAGIFGAIEERKNAPLIWEALQRRAIHADLLLAGTLAAEVARWAESVPPGPRGRILVRDGFLSNEELDKLVAAVDVVPIALTNNGPSGIMGKALAAGVPVVTAGSEVRARELEASGGGEAASLDADSIGASIERVLGREPAYWHQRSAPLVTPEEYARNLLGVDESGRHRGRTRKSRRSSAAVG